MSLVFIVADSVRHDAFGYAGGRATTPTVDTLAKQGIQFDRVMSAAPWTVPSVASMLTGTYSHRLGLAKWEQPWPKDYDTLFDCAARSGYQVASFVFDTSHLFKRVPSAKVVGPSQDTTLLLSWLKQNRHSEYFVFIHYFWTHIPYVDQPMSAATWKQVSDRVLSAMRTSESARQGVKKLYSRSIERFSEQWLPSVLDAVDLDSTTIVLTADHGESWGEREETQNLKDVFDLHGNTLYDEVLRVPLIIKPHATCGSTGRHITELVRTVDIMPTLADMLDLDAADNTIKQDGVSLFNPLRSDAPLPALDAISVMNKDYVDQPHLPDSLVELWRAFALTTERYKQIWYPDEDYKIAFDLKNDPSEIKDISSSCPELFESGWQRLRDELNRAKVGKLLKEDADIIRKRLEKLGYI